MKKIAIISNDIYANKIHEDLALKNALENLNLEAEIISWENKNINYYNYDCLILKSVWGYQKKYYEFKKWLEYLKNNNIDLFNSVDMIIDNIRKDIQFGILDKYNIPHVPTIFQKEKIDKSKIGEKQVIKPIISGSGFNTFKSDNIDLEIYNKIMQEEDNGIIIQPFIEEIKNGEYSIIFIDGENTHNMVRYPGIFTEKIKPYEIKTVPQKVLNLAYRVKNIPEYAGALYMRVDIVNDNDPLIMEVELAEPDLLTRNLESNEPIKKLSKAIKRRLK